VRCVIGAYELGFEGDDDVDLGFVEFLQALGLEEVGFVASCEAAEGIWMVALGAGVSLCPQWARGGIR
jgi:hypothetical protein